MLTKVAQLFLSWRIERSGHWAGAALAGAAVSCLSLLLVPAISSTLSALGGARLSLFVAVSALSSLAAAVYQFAFLTWMAELIPEPLRGVFWGLRGRNAGLVGIVASIVAASCSIATVSARARCSLDSASRSLPARSSGASASGSPRSCPQPRRKHSRDHQHNLGQCSPRRCTMNFRRFLGFSGLWSFSAGWMAPFYMVYMLEQLHLSFLAVTLFTAITNVLMATTQTHWGRLGYDFGNEAGAAHRRISITLTPLVWLVASPERRWPVVIVQVLSGIGWSAFHVSQSNLSLKLAPERRWSVRTLPRSAR